MNPFPLISQYLVSLVFQYRYIALFPVAAIEGPVITMASGFLISLGLLNPLLALPILIAGDLAGDVFYYCIGKFGQRWSFTHWILNKFKFESVKDKIVHSFDRHGGKILLFGKLTHAAGAIFLIGAGYARMQMVSFLWYSLIGTIIKSSILLYVGYLVGSAYNQYVHYFEYGTLVLTIFLIGLILMIFRFMPEISQRFFRILPDDLEK